MLSKVKALWSKLPVFVQKFITDFVETGIAAVAATGVAFPHSLADARAAAIIVALALGGALVSAARRAVPGLWAWLVSLWANA
jgi:hypothetical protein